MSKKISLPEVVCAATESLKMAIEVVFGARIRLYQLNIRYGKSPKENVVRIYVSGVWITYDDFTRIQIDSIKLDMQQFDNRYHDLWLPSFTETIIDDRRCWIDWGFRGGHRHENIVAKVAVFICGKNPVDCSVGNGFNNRWEEPLDDMPPGE